MDINEFLSAYEDIVKGVANDQVIERTFNELFERVEGTYLEEDFRKADDKIGRIMCIDKAAHYIHSRDADLLAFAFPDADPTFVKDTLDRLSGLEAVSPVRKASRGYFTTFASTEGFVFLSKQVGVLKANRASRDEVKEDIAEYERLFKAGIASHAELLTLSRYHGDKGQRYLDEVKKKSFTPDDPMVVGGYASVEVVDKEGHLITTEALTKAFFRFMDSFRTRNVNFAHSDVQAGWPLKVWINNAGEIYRSGVDDKGLYLVSEVRPDITIANKVEKEIEAGIIRSYSIAGSALDKSVETKNGRVIMVVNDLELAEISFCERPVNQESNFDIIKGYSVGKDAILGKTIDTNGPNPTMGQEPSLGEVFKAEGEGSTQLVGMSDSELKTLGEKAGANFEAVDFKEFKMGLKVEQEHYDLTGMDPFKTAKIVLAHMRELKDYYTQLDAMEKRGEKVVKAQTSHKDELMQFFTEHPAPDDKEVHALAEKLKIEPDALEEEIYSLLADELGKGSVVKDIKGLSLGEKCKAVFKVSEDDMTKDEQSQNDATLRKEMSHSIDRGSNETNRQSPDVQTPVTKVGEIHMGKTGLKEFKKFLGKDQPPAMAPPRPGLTWSPMTHRWVKPGDLNELGERAYAEQAARGGARGPQPRELQRDREKSEKGMSRVSKSQVELFKESCAKSSTTDITAWKPSPSEKIKIKKITWGDPRKSLDKLNEFVSKDLPARGMLKPQAIAERVERRALSGASGKQAEELGRQSDRDVGNIDTTETPANRKTMMIGKWPKTSEYRARFPRPTSTPKDASGLVSKKALDELSKFVAKDLPAKPGKGVEYRRPEQTEEHSRDVARSLAGQKPVGGTRTPGTTSDKEYTSRTGMIPRRVNPGDTEKLPERKLEPAGYKYSQKSVTESDMAGMVAFLDFMKDGGIHNARKQR